MPSFDIVSEVNFDEMRNAVQNTTREISTRYDFKGSSSAVEALEQGIKVTADDELKLKQVHEMLRGHLHKRGIEPGQLDYGKVEPATGLSVRQMITVKEGIDREMSKKIVKEIKGSKMKVQVAIQGDELRVSGKKRDDLQAAIQFVKDMGLEQPVQFKNFRD